MRTPRLRFLSALLSVAMLFTLLPTAAFAAVGDTFTDDTVGTTGIIYKVTGSDVSVYKYTGSDPNVVIPETVNYSGNTYTVTSIFKSAFDNNTTITSVKIPNTVAVIAALAFHGCTNLKSVSFGEPATLEIRSYAFRNCSSLEEVLYNGTSAQWFSIKGDGRALLDSYVKYRRTITFETNTTDKIDSQPVYDGHLVTKPTKDPERSGFKFVGWYVKDSQKEYNFSTPVTRNLDLYAKWQPANCTVTFDLNGHGTNTTTTVSHNTKIQKPTPPPRRLRLYLC